MIRLYTIYDKLAQVSCPPFTAVNDAVAMRSFKSLIRDVAPVDRDEYRICFVGLWDEKNMVFRSDDEAEELDVSEVLEALKNEADLVKAGQVMGDLVEGRRD